jgi:hypothetical protein
VRLKVKQLESLPYDFDLYGLLNDSGPPSTDVSISSKLCPFWNGVRQIDI